MKGFFGRIGNALARWMYGRYGSDQLNLVLLIAALVLMLLTYIPFLRFCSFLAFLLLLWSLFRSFSKKTDKRRRELQKFQSLIRRPKNFFKLARNKWRDRKTHLYFKCPKCKAVLRVPRGKGSITVTCPRCNERVEKNT